MWLYSHLLDMSFSGWVGIPIIGSPTNPYAGRLAPVSPPGEAPRAGQTAGAGAASRL